MTSANLAFGVVLEGTHELGLLGVQVQLGKWAGLERPETPVRPPDVTARQWFHHPARVEGQVKYNSWVRLLCELPISVDCAVDGSFVLFMRESVRSTAGDSHEPVNVPELTADALKQSANYARMLEEAMSFIGLPPRDQPQWIMWASED